MKKFETEKHNIPEGATHHGIYGCDTDVYFKEDNGVFLQWHHESWSLSQFAHHKWVKPIPQTKEVEWDGEGLPPVGVECEFRFKTNIDAPEDDDFTSWFYGSVDYYGAVKVLITSSHEAEGCFWTELVEFRKPETPEAKKEREELEAAEAMVKIFEEAVCKQTYRMLDGMKALLRAGYRKGE